MRRRPTSAARSSTSSTNVEAFLRNVDWDHVNRQLKQAEAAKAGADATGLREHVPVAS